MERRVEFFLQAGISRSLSFHFSVFHTIARHRIGAMRFEFAVSDEGGKGRSEAYCNLNL